jgi:GNAT superfamily N-acetyltransferase
MNWYKKAQNQITAEDIANKWSQQGIKVYVYETDNLITLSLLVVPKDRRKQGIGTTIMQELVSYADQVGKRFELSPGLKDKYQGTTSRKRLVDFYKRFNFRENKGRNIDFTSSEDMFREPRIRN